MVATFFSSPAGATVVGDWNNAALAELRAHKLGPPIVARALAIAHTCMYDAWAAYDPVAIGTVHHGGLRRPVQEHTDANKTKAISFAAYRCLLNLFPDLPAVGRLTTVMTTKGYDPSDTSTDPSTPSGVGNTAASGVIEARRHDGSNQYGDLHPGAYSDYTGYAPRNLPLEFCIPTIACPTPFHVEDPNHWQPLIGPTGVTQVYIGPHWDLVTPFALFSAHQFDDIGLAPPPDIFKNAGHYHKNANEILKFSRELTADQKLIVEYWADGPASELPPGHWGLFAQFISQRDGHTIDQDAKMFFALHNASFDAGIVAWHLKRKFDGTRPITAIRFVKQGKQILAFGGPGHPTELIPGEKWMPYNPGSNLTPAFPGYISGHSTFSRASATVLQLFTGSDHFGFSTLIPANFGRVEPGIPAVDTIMSFETFGDAATAAGISRLYGGIHFIDDNVRGQQLGALIGLGAWLKAEALFHGIAP
ncbi:MAG: vanadium-dependent haloperoxidase [Candidatus Rokubacteria bacterium]|nr:vanadium-dependent haloperoxidase [Candidatus Rokubacteria bacterium]